MTRRTSSVAIVALVLFGACTGAASARAQGIHPRGPGPGKQRRHLRGPASGRRGSRPRFVVLRAHAYRGYTTQRFTPGAQIQPQMIVETSASGRSVSRVGFVVECDAGQRSAIVFVRGLAIARRSGVFARRAAALLSFADGTRLPGELEVRGTFVGRRSVHGTLMFEGHGCSVRHARWAASG